MPLNCVHRYQHRTVSVIILTHMRIHIGCAIITDPASCKLSWTYLVFDRCSRSETVRNDNFVTVVRRLKYWCVEGHILITDIARVFTLARACPCACACVRSVRSARPWFIVRCQACSLLPYDALRTPGLGTCAWPLSYPTTCWFSTPCNA